MTPYASVPDDEVRSLLAEAVHTGFRKGVDCLPALSVHRLITDMDRSDWAGYVDWLAWSIGESGYAIVRVTA